MAEDAVELKRSAEKEMERLPTTVLERMVARLEKFEREPRPPGSVKLKGSDSLYRIRVGDYRAVYLVDDEAALVTVTHQAS